jgi:hypothetical protein
MEELDIKLKLLAGLPWKVDGVGKIYPPTLRKIVDIGYTRYLYFVHLMTLDPKDLIDDEDLAKQVVGFDFFCSDDTKQELINDYIEAIKFFFCEEEAYFSIKSYAVFLGNIKSELRYINRDNYNKIKDVIGLITCSKDVNETSFNPAGERARQIIEKLKRRKEILRRQKKNSEDDEFSADIFDWISAVSSMATGVNKTTIWDYTFNQFMDEYRRLEHINQYEITTNAMMHVGGDKLELKHWSSKIIDE